MLNNKQLAKRDRSRREAHRRVNMALYLWPRPRRIEQIEAEESRATGSFVQSASALASQQDPRDA